MVMQIRKAERRKAKLRIGLSGPSGSGKTYSALLIGKGITRGDLSKVGIIDTENGSADLYADLGDFSVIRLESPYSPERYIEAIKALEDAGMQVIIIDSVSHEWDGKGGALEINELIAKTKFKGNTWAAWSETTPRHQKFIEAIVSSKVHLITTARSKTDTIQTEDKKIKKVGLKEIQREGFEYELTLNFNVDRDGHYAVASKDRTNIFDKLDPFLISEETGTTLIDWADSGAEPIVVPPSLEEVNKEYKKEMGELLKYLVPEVTLKTADDYKNKVRELCSIDLIEGNLEAIVVCLRRKREAKDKEVQDMLGDFENKTAGTDPKAADREVLNQETAEAAKALDATLNGTAEIAEKQPQTEAAKQMQAAAVAATKKDEF